ncbi:hypothetical protein, unlikely [Trypanosoma brucei gambiense DAL972]|uniref:Uncharacterized protein n=1 Tax=Trypanosoma brucei gambiense (strain MHOM/CI/86/DAL972) TaxID=679716 RepID=C9ZMS5_TRYB9|nr:hypothetical protein, unlikely [Trypanosoma brucei gambiense DAL972]CBH10578.1 hypothetical protein, unlikely [Trypanosoma brucei gambiense DAL972]|eukprot:XP_011772867.1 hypothetical protein, unlikely [Trypanosoma brucei gambiense DAL972]
MSPSELTLLLLLSYCIVVIFFLPTVRLSVCPFVYAWVRKGTALFCLPSPFPKRAIDAGETVETPKIIVGEGGTVLAFQLLAGDVRKGTFTRIYPHSHHRVIRSSLLSVPPRPCVVARINNYAFLCPSSLFLYIMMDL